MSLSKVVSILIILSILSSCHFSVRSGNVMTNAFWFSLCAICVRYKTCCKYNDYISNSQISICKLFYSRLKAHHNPNIIKCALISNKKPLNYLLQRQEDNIELYLAQGKSKTLNTINFKLTTLNTFLIWRLYNKIYIPIMQSLSLF